MWNKIKNYSKEVLSSLKTDDNQRSNTVNKDLNQNVDYLKKNLAESNDLVFRELYIGDNKQFKANMIFIDEMINKEVLQSEILRPLMFKIKSIDGDNNIKEELFDTLSQSTLPIGEVKTTNLFDKIIASILSGNAILFIDNFSKAFIFGIKGVESRSISFPQIEATTRGPQDSFTETLNTNLSLIRRRLRDSNLMVETRKVGDRTNTDLALLYLEDVADKNIVKKINQRLDHINIDGVLDIGYINQYLEDNWASLFPQFQNTERPDRAVANLLEGKIILILDGSPFISIMPTNFIQFFQSPEDYYDSHYIGTIYRIIRLVSAIFSLTLPAIYISLVSFHHELIPPELAISIARARSGVPFPSYLEAFIMELSLELLREAGVRLPGPIGQTVSIVGGLVLGDAAVKAGLVSPPMVIIVAITAISSFSIPSYAASIPLRILRYPLMVLAALFSVYGIVIGWLFILIHLCSLESFDQPYFAPFGPLKLSDLKDSIMRAPFRWMSKRPISISNQQQDRQDRAGEDTDEN